MRGKNSQLVKPVEPPAMGSNVEGKKWKELNRLLDGMLEQHYAWGLVVDESEPERPLSDRGRDRAGVAPKPTHQLEKSKEAGEIPRRPGVYSLVSDGTLLGKMRGGRQEPAKK